MNSISSDEILSANNFLVGIGASAGGLQALEAFFGSLPPNPDAAFVVVQHLSPDFRSLMVELLQRRTHLPVRVIESGTPVIRNRVYVLPPGYMVSLRGRQLLLEERSGGATDYPIDHFFLSLAQERGDRTISILLSGTGRDGTEGLKAVSRAGGIALVQSRETAQFGAMPSGPISSGLVDEILSPEELAQAVYDIICYTTTEASLATETEPLLPQEQLNEILTLLQQQEDIDFSQYKLGTLHRRIIHRLLLSKANTIEQYIAYLSETPEEIKNLRQDLLIGATRFFRDPDMWRTLQAEVLPQLIETLQHNQPLRMWITACSTGEEAYSMAIAVDEVMRQLQQQDRPVKIFATDIDPEALVIASQGAYVRAVVRDIEPERLERYFTREGSTYRIKKSIRSRVVFASHDLTKNPGFSQMHLVSCRNLLIYMQSSLQEQVLRVLHFSLATRGALILGPSEHLGPVSYAFHTLDQHWKIFRKRRDVQLPISRSVRSPTIQPSVALARSTKSVPPPYERLIASVLRLRFGEQPTTCVLVNESYQTLHIFLNTARLLEFPLGEVSTSVLEIVPSDLKVPLSTALHRAKRDREAVLYSDIQVSDPDSVRQVNLWVGIAEIDKSTTETCLIVLLELVEPAEKAETAADSEFNPNSELSQQLRELEFELQQTRENLQTSIEELETANEEQQATNEELLASNEELQSTNEELQSVNEELYTVNAENQERIRQLTELSADIDNLLRSTDIGVVFLDRVLNIRKFTPAAAQVFNFRPGDTGRPLGELVNHLDIDNIMTLIQQVAASEQPQETEAINLKTGDRLLLRILPYRREDGSSNGVVLTLIAINELKQVQDELLQSNMLLEDHYLNIPFGLAFLDRDLRFIRVNQVLAELDGSSIEDHIGKQAREVLPADIGEMMTTHHREVLATGEPIVDTEIVDTTPAQSGEERIWLASYHPVLLDGEGRGVGVVVTDFTEQKRLQTELLENKTLVQQLAESNSEMLVAFHIASGKISFANSAAANFLGLTGEAQAPDSQETLHRSIHPDDRDAFDAHLADLSTLEDGEALSGEFRVRNRMGSWRRIRQRSTVLSRTRSGKALKVLGICTEIAKHAEAREI